MDDEVFMSPDGRFIWTGTEWVPAPPDTPPLPVTELKQEEWVSDYDLEGKKEIMNINKIQTLPLTKLVSMGLNLVGTTILVILVGGGLMWGGALLQTPPDLAYICDDAGRGTIWSSELNDGYDDCIYGSDERGSASEDLDRSPSDDKSGSYFMGYLVTFLGFLVLIGGLVGLQIKVITDGVSAAIFLNRE
ncbi:hypothetical protein N9M47_00235 [Candidatus Poseidoniales archaeon]|jgi:hypothetical protein|nr:hypothetical protein [Candidatus Poseidoniales archaeon]